MNIELISVNVSKPKTVEFNGESITTGIYKTPVHGTVKVTSTNLQGDGQADLQVHGGTHKAVYVYPYEHYAYWGTELDRDDLEYGQFGENFTTMGLMENQVHIGDVFKIGSAVFEVTQPRTPCFKLAIRMKNPFFPKLFLQSGRLGFYMKVLEQGEICGSDVVEAQFTNTQGFTISDIWQMAFFDTDSQEALERALQLHSLGPEWKFPIQQQLDKMDP